MTQTSISVWGSCVSRDIFNRKFIENYKDYFQVLHDQQHVSVISLMATPYTKDVGELTGDVTKFYKDVFKRDLSKKYLEDLKENPPEFLIMDFYTDTFYGSVVEKTGTIITNKLWQYRKLNYFSELKLGKEYSVYKNSFDFIEKWKTSFDEFMRFMKSYCPKTKIIINKAKFVNKYWDEEENEFFNITKLNKDNWKEFHIDRFNIIWNLFDTYAIEKYQLDSINFDIKKYYGDENHEWGLFYVHYNQQYYEDLFESLIKIVEIEKQPKFQKIIQKLGFQ
ncbi:DUF6270 domain-containing protein [Vagococcus carniphilus]|uniref:DUF6270 domain-containing protein n=1 Tax=Vagococcus carniphilus TaxID=218144 RepID=UPI00288E96DD|nr:DUF6270 domain-containing protein [Vagococcus carniphilus]MDT2865719.1 DUF6270 domain-containing protein [Vagococcus carniphilus]